MPYACVSEIGQIARRRHALNKVQWVAMTEKWTEVISDRAALRSCESEWRTLAERRSNAFVTPEWFGAWLDNYGNSDEPAVPVARRADGSLFGLMPLVLARSGRPRTLRFAGAAHADRLHPVCLQEDELSVASTAVATMTAASPDWTVAVLDNVDARASWWQALARASAVLGVATYRDTVLPIIELDTGDWDGYLANRPRNFREQARRYPRRLARKHSVHFRRTTDESELDRDMATLFRLHDARWAPRGGSSLESQRVRRFHVDFARSALRQGWLRLWFLEIDDVEVAAWYGWRLGDSYAYYQAGFDPAWQHLSVGFVLMVHTVRSAIEEGASRYELLLGEEAYKSRFANAGESVHTVTLSRSRSAHLATAAEAYMWKGSRRLPASLRSLPPVLANLLPTLRRR
jgi:CelD/BcsL family acetyltransferase involved in cellulose biosynthesis